MIERHRGLDAIIPLPEIEASLSLADLYEFGFKFLAQSRKGAKFLKIKKFKTFSSFASLRLCATQCKTLPFPCVDPSYPACRLSSASTASRSWDHQMRAAPNRLSGVSGDNKVLPDSMACAAIRRSKGSS